MSKFKQEIESLTKELNSLRKEFGESSDYVFVGKEDADAVKQINSEILEYKNTLDEINDTWGAIDGILQDVKKEFGKASDGMKVAMSSFNRLQSISNKFQEDALGIQTMNSKEIKGNITSIQKEIAIQQKALNLLKAKKENGEALTDNEEKLVKELEGENIQNNLALKLSKERLAQEKKITNAMGLTGAIAKGLTKSLEKIGFSNMSEVFEEASEAARTTASRLTDGGKKAGGFITKIKSMGSAFKVVGKAILKNLTDPLFLAGMAMKAMKSTFNFFADAYKKGEEAAKVISDENTGMARSLGLAQGAASRLAGSVAGMGPTTAASKASIEGIYKAMGSTEKLSRNTLKVFVKLNTFAGMSAESLAKFQKFAKKGGEDAGTMVKNMANTALHAVKNNKLALSQKELLEETANQSSYVKLQFAGQGPALVKAVAQSRALGVNMEKARNMAKSLLNFEDSIAAEMEAELLTGKQLNLEEARALALKGDNVGAAKLIAEQVGGAAEFMSMNVLQQEALAKAAGMGVDEMSAMLDGQQDMKKSGSDLVKDQTDGLRAMSSEVSIREAAENRARKAAESNIAVYKELAPLINQLKDTWTEIKTIVMESISTNVIEPMVKFISSKEGKEFLKKLPGYVDKALTKTKELITNIGSFLSDTDSKYPWLKKLLAGLGGGAILLKVTGLDKTLVKGAKTLFSGLMGDKSAVKSDLGLELGTVSNPMQVEMVNSMNVGDMIGNKGRAGFMKQITTLFKNPKVMFRALRMKGGLFGKALGKFGPKLLSVASSISSGFGSVFKGIKTGLANSFSGLKKMFSSPSKPKVPKSSGGSVLGNIWNKVKKGASSAWKGAKNIGSKALGGIKSAGKGISNMGGAAWKGVKSAGSSAMKGIKSAVKFLNPMSYLKKYLPKFLKSKSARGIVSKIPKFGTIANLAMIAADLAMTGANVGAAASQGVDPQNIGKMVIQGLGDAGGTLLGGALGSFIPVPGVGTLLGGFLGGMAGKALGGLIADNVDATPIGNWMIKSFGGGKAKDGGSAEDFIMQNGTITKFRKDDIVMGGTNLTGGGADSAKTLQLLERLVNAVEKGGTVTLDGQKVGNALVAGSYRMQ